MHRMFPGRVMLLASRAAVAQYGPYWGAPEAIDDPVLEVSSPSGTPLVHEPDWAPWYQSDRWHVVYVKSGEVCHRVHTAGGRQAVETLTAGAINPRDPEEAFGGNRLHVVWVEDRTGHAEVWTRSWDGTSWSSEQ